MKSRTVKKHLRQLRTFIELHGDPIETRIAYAMECAVRWVTEDGIVNWPGLVAQAKDEAHLLREELRDEVRKGR